MPYITTEKVKEIRETIKKEFPEFKFSIRKEDYSSVNISVMSGPELFKDWSHTNINQYHFERHYEDEPEVLEFLKKLFHVITCVHEQKTVYTCEDYGNWPNYYLNVSIGKWDKPYQVK